MKRKLLFFTLLPLSTLVIAENFPNSSTIADHVTKVVSTASAPAPQFEVHDFRFEGVLLPPKNEIRNLLQSYIGKPTTLSDLNHLAEQISAHYHQAGYPLAVAVIPPQRIENGVVTIQVIEGSIGAVNLENASRISDSTVRAHLADAIRSGSSFQQDKSDRGLMLLRGLAGTQQVDYRLAPSPSETGKADVTVVLSPAPLLNGSVSVDNYGSKSTGRIRTHADVYLNSPFKRGERFSLRLMSSFKGVDSAKLAADVPVGSRGTKWTTEVGRTRYDLGGAFKDLQASGHADTISLGIRHPLVLGQKRNLWLSMGGNGGNCVMKLA